MRSSILLFILLYLSLTSALISPKETIEIAGEKLGDAGRNTNVYAEILGENLLKFQDLFMGALGFVSLGFFDMSGDLDFVTFLFFVLLFMMLYGIVGFFFDKFNFGIAFVITLLAFIGIDEMSLRALLLEYEAMGVTITVVLPILILLAFTFRIYQKAYEGRSRTSPFYVEMFNLVFLVFFGVYFIRYSYSEEGAIAIVRFISGWILIGFGIFQTILYKTVAGMFHDWLRDNEKFKRDWKEMRHDAAEQILEAQADMDV